ncbi:MAG: hypothetical protein DWQ01_02730 [Planctomycetota bacterium]|nr:MAG: hypothetical protein DWQ01_02730 [Planctomycetota bacterium]
MTRGLLSTLPFRLLSLALLAGPLAAQDLERALENADLKAEAEQWSEARQVLLAALSDQESQEALLAHYGTVRNRLAYWAFRERYPSLGPLELMHGEVVSYKERTGKIKIRYDWTQMSSRERQADFLRVKEVWYYRLPFEDAIKIDIAGTWPADDIEPVAMVMGYQRAEECGWRLVPGFLRESDGPTIRMPMQVRRFGKPFENLAQSVEKLDEPEGKWAYGADFRRGSFTLRRGRKKIGSWKTRYPNLVPGLVGFSTQGLQEVTLEGELKKEALGPALEEKRAALQADFEEEYDFHSELPDWFQELVKASEAKDHLRLPEGAPATVAAEWENLLQAYGEEAFSIDEWIEAHKLKGQALEFYARAVEDARSGRWLKCRENIAEARNRKLDFGPLLALEAEARYFCGERDAALRQLEAALRTWPDDAGYTFARLHGRRSGPEAMAAATSKAMESGGLAPRIMQLETRLRKSLAGPAGAESGVFQGRAVRVLSDGSNQSAANVGEAADTIIPIMAPYLVGFLQPKEPLRILHFETESSLKAFLTGLGLDEEIRGYVPELRTVFYHGEGVPGRHPRLIDAVCRAFMDTCIDVTRAPRWFVEGNAAFFAWSRINDDGALVAQVHHPFCAEMRGNEELFFTQPHQMMQLPPWEENKHAIWVAAEGWLLVHYLRNHPDADRRNLLAGYIQSLLRGQDRRTVYQQSFNEKVGGELPGEMADYRKEMIRKHREQMDS